MKDSQFYIGSGTQFRFLSLVAPSEIPLRLIVGPSLRVSTANKNTEQWFNDNLLHFKEPPGAYATASEQKTLGLTCSFQSLDLGILLKVDGDLRTCESGSRITELLLHAVSHTALTVGYPDSCEGLSLEGRTGKPIVDQIPNGQLAFVCAVPLCSDNLRVCEAPEWPSTPPPEGFDSECGRAIGFDKSLQATESKASNKCHRLRLMFDDAVTESHRAKRRSAISIPCPMNSAESQQELPSELISAGVSHTFKTSSEGKIMTRGPHHSRSGSPDSRYTAAENRPRSSQSMKLSSPHQIINTAAIDSNSSALYTGNLIEHRNKKTLARTVMAGMRLYGLAQKRKSNVPGMCPGSAAERHSNEDDEDEYKLVYHQTFKAAAFALRRSTTTFPVDQGTMRDVVDRLLGMFCNNEVKAKARRERSVSPWTKTNAGNSNSGDHGFDMPSSSARITRRMSMAEKPHPPTSIESTNSS